MRKYRKVVICLTLCFALICMMSGMSYAKSAKSWGKIIPDNQARNAFETYQISPDMNYYISGSEANPNAILGLNKAYILDSDLWKKVDLTESKLKALVTVMKSRAMDFGQPQFGFAVLNNKSEQIGVWYSILGATTAVKMKEDNKVMIYTPNQNTYERYEGED
jgi:hypothetical protein